MKNGSIQKQIRLVVVKNGSIQKQIRLVVLKIDLYKFK